MRTDRQTSTPTQAGTCTVQVCNTYAVGLGYTAAFSLAEQLQGREQTKISLHKWSTAIDLDHVVDVEEEQATRCWCLFDIIESL